MEPIAGEVVLTDYSAVQEALFDRHLSRSFDKRSFVEGNIRDGHVSIMHGAEHRARRRIENTQFRIDELRHYEHVLFPPVVDRFLASAVQEEEVDLFRLGGSLAVVLAAKRAGFDFDMGNRQDLEDLVAYVEAFSQISAIIDSRDPEAVRQMAKKVLRDFKNQFGMPSLRRRKTLLSAYQRGELGEDDLPHDIMTTLLQHHADPRLNLKDDFAIIRGAAIYLQGGTHTSAQTLINCLDLLFDARETRPEYWDRIVQDTAFAQRCMHEALRLRPTTPRAKRRAEEPTAISGSAIPEGTMVILDFYSGNRDAGVFGSDAEEFRPDRLIPDRVNRWGLSFGAGPHACPGRTVAAGLPQARADAELDVDHLYGLVPLMLQAIVRADPEPHPHKPQARDDRTERFTRWNEYWVVFGRNAGPS